jgi:hypothetical protein
VIESRALRAPFEQALLLCRKRFKRRPGALTASSVLIPLTPAFDSKRWNKRKTFILFASDLATALSVYSKVQWSLGFGSVPTLTMTVCFEHFKQPPKGAIFRRDRS